MAELLVRVRTIAPDPAPQDGDIICAFNQRRIELEHAGAICHIKMAGFNGSGLRPRGTVYESFESRTRQFRYERVSSTEVRAIELRSGPPERESILVRPNVDAWITRRVRHERHRIFGTAGREVWYGGRYDYSPEAVGDIWSEIEAKTPSRRSAHQRWPLGRREKRAYLALPVDDFDESTRSLLERPDLDPDDPQDEDAVTLGSRKHGVDDWRSLALGVTVEEVENETVDIDVREGREFARVSIVTVRSRSR